MGVYYRIPNQNNDTDKLSFEELRDASKAIAFAFMGDFILPEINWEHHTVGTNRARRFLKDLDDNFMEKDLKGTNSERCPPWSAAC